MLAEREPALHEHIGDVVADWPSAVGERLGLGEDELEQLRLAAELHDIGKLAIPDASCRSPAPSTSTSGSSSAAHRDRRADPRRRAGACAEVARIVRATHERWDGGGYVDGLAGARSRCAARIIAVCDAYAAMTSDRPYRRAMTPQEALAELRRCAGSQFDPEVVVVFCRLHESVTVSTGAPAEAGSTR